MKLFGLKDSDGDDVALTISYAMDDNRGIVNYFIGDISVINKEKPPQFKTGDWVKLSSTGEINRIKEVTGNNLRYDDGCYHQEFAGYIRHATPQEIESHLKKICDEKYIGKKVKCLWTGEVGRIQEFKLYSDTFGEYCLYFDEEGNCIRVYDQGRFAEIVPDKKKLPKTKVELEILIKELRVAKSLPLYNEDIDFFLDKYED